MNPTLPGNSPVPLPSAARRGPDLLGASGLRGSRLTDWLFRHVALLFALSSVVLIAGIGLTLLLAARGGMAHTGLHFFTSAEWDPESTHNIFGLLPFVYGTLVTATLALLIAVPLGLGAAIFLAELAPRWLSGPISFLVELLAAVPSIVYGFWAILNLVPILQLSVEPWLSARFGHIPFFMQAADSGTGQDYFAAGIVLAIMVLPFITAVSRDILKTVPQSQREAAYGMGATRWEAIKSVVLRYASGGIIGAVMLGLGRAIGETMAVTFVIGSATNFPERAVPASFSLFRPGYTMTSVLANQYPGPESDLHRSVLTEVALALFVLTIVINGLARILVWLTAMRAGGTTESAFSVQAKSAAALGTRALLAAAFTFGLLYQIAHDVQAKGIRGLFGLTALFALLLIALVAVNRIAPGKAYYTQWRKIGSGFALAVCALCAFTASAALIVIFYYVARLGLPTLNANFFSNPRLDGTGGNLHAIKGTGIFILFASLLGIPLGVLGGVYLAEFGNNRLGWCIRFAADLLVGVPSIVLGIFAAALIYVPLKGYQAMAGAFALGVMMTPTVMRTTEELVRLVPTALREGSLALGATHAKTVWQVVLPAARGGIVTGILLATARIAGETAPLLMVGCNTSLPEIRLDKTLASLPMQIYTLRDSTSSAAYQQLWGVALLLVLLVLVFSLLARYFTRDRMKTSA